MGQGPSLDCPETYSDHYNDDWVNPLRQCELEEKEVDPQKTIRMPLQKTNEKYTECPTITDIPVVRNQGA